MVSFYEKKYNVSIRTKDWAWHYGCLFDESRRKILEGQEENMELHRIIDGIEHGENNCASLNKRQISIFKTRFEGHLKIDTYPPYNPHGF